jgi:hypothetical protein
LLVCCLLCSHMLVGQHGVASICICACRHSICICACRQLQQLNAPSGAEGLAASRSVQRHI